MARCLRCFLVIGAAWASPPVDLVIVGAGPGGAYAAWRAATSGLSVTVLERAQRPGGRIHSLRGQGTKRDLVVEAGAYRFAPEPVVDKIGNITWRIATPLTAAIIQELKLPSAVYNPDPSMWDHGMHKIVDEHGNDAGYLTMVEKMLEIAAAHGADIQYGAEVASLSSAEGADAPLGVRLRGGQELQAKSLLLNLPQHPLLELLRRSEGQAMAAFPKPLYVPVSYPIMKLYIHYDDAWWRNDLGLVAGAFFNKPSPVDPSSEGWVTVPGQLPAPLQGQYHDGDLRCDGPGGRCRGYLQAFYGNDEAHNGAISGAIKYYSNYADSIAEDSAVQLAPSVPHHRDVLDLVHASLVELHREALDAINATERVANTPPTGGVLSIWSQGVGGIRAGCHLPKTGKNPKPDDLPSAALQPFPNLKLFVANEAFGMMTCFAEGSLMMAAAAMHHLNVSQPAWVHEEAVQQLLNLGVDEYMPPTDPFLLPGGASPRVPARHTPATAFAI